MDNIVGDRISKALAEHAGVDPSKTINWTAEHHNGDQEPVVVTFEMIHEIELEEFNKIVQESHQ